MKPDVNVAQPQRSPDDGQFLAIAGLVVGGSWAFAAISAFGGRGWEPQSVIIRQWAASGVLTAVYLAFFLVPRNTAAQRFLRWVLRAATPLVAMLRGSSTRMRILSYGVGFSWLLINVYAIFFGDSFFKSLILFSDVAVFGIPIAAGSAGRAILVGIFRQAQNDIWTSASLVIQWILSSATFATALWLVVTGHREIAFVLGTLTTLAFLRLARAPRYSAPSIAILWASSVCVWALALGYTYTPLDQWILSALPVTGLAAVAFAMSFAAVLRELTATRAAHSQRAIGRRSVWWICALFAFAELGLRTDGLIGDWIPYHRSFWVSPAEFIRSGAWPLWDYPTQYGVLSALSLAFWPSSSVWQALYYQTAVVLAIQASIVYFLFCFRRAGWANQLFAICFAAAAVYSAQGARAPFGMRLYPQLGLRFHWLEMILVIALIIHCNRHHRFRRRVGFTVGYAVWAASVAWSFESGVFAGFAWATFVVLDAAFGAIVLRGSAAWRRFIALVPLVVLPLLFYCGLEVIYRVHLGHGPDWLSYFEFSAAYEKPGSGIVQDAPNPRGALWTLVIMLVGVTSAGVAAVRRGRYDCLPVIGACWAGTWIASAYFAGEALDNHITGLAAVFAVVIGTILALERSGRASPFVPLATKAAFAPIMILVLAYAFGSVGTMYKVRAPLVFGGSLDSTADFPPIHGELLGLFKRAGVRPSDEVILPTSYLANKLELGELLPFVVDRNGRLVEQMAWLPISPIGPFNTLFTLPYERRRTFLERYFRDVGQTGWLVGYRRNANCSALIPGLRSAKAMESDNYRIARCMKPRIQEATNQRPYDLRRPTGGAR